MNILQMNWSPSLGIDLGFFTIRYYSLMFVIAFSLGLYIMKKIYFREKIPIEKLDKLFFHTVIATIVGARLGHVFFYDWAYYKTHLLEIFLPFEFTPHFKFTGFSGLASHGAAITILWVLYYHSKKILKTPFLFLLDRVAIVVALGAGFVRIGNLMNSEIIGKKTDFALGFVFENLGEDFARHPAQLYESLGYFALFFLLWMLYWKTNIAQKKGVLFGIFMFVMWSLRFLIEFVKEPQKIERASWFLNTGQLLSIPFILIGIYFILRKNTPKKSI